jgi:predicted MPP superfamily phosphohydrolase
MNHLLLVAAWVLGQGCLLVLGVNIAHGIGWRSRWLEPATYVAGALAAMGTAAGGAWGIAHEPGEWPIVLRFYAIACAGVGLVGLPVCTLERLLRRPPRGVSGDSTPIAAPGSGPVESPPLRWAGTGRYAWMHRLPGNESLRPRLETWRVELPGLPEALDGLSLLHLTDLHMAPAYDPRFFADVLAAACDPEPDIVALTGDVVEHAEAIEWIGPLLAPVQARLGRFAILGNHDALFDERRIRAALVEAGYADIDGSWMRVTLAGGSIAVGGTSAPWGPSLDPGQAPVADLRIVLSHTPDLFVSISGWGLVDLLLCGHVHGGQVRLPLIGPVLMPSRYSRRFDRGFFRRGRTRMYVGDGLGAKHPLRWGCPPAVARLVLHAAERRPPAAKAIWTRGTLRVGR